MEGIDLLDRHKMKILCMDKDYFTRMQNSYEGKKCSFFEFYTPFNESPAFTTAGISNNTR